MKSANFQWTSPKRKYPIYGKVTLKDDGKISVSMPGADRYTTSPAERYQAKQHALTIVALDFNHPDASNVQVQESAAVENSLAAVLTERTQEFKTKFIELTKESAKRMHDSAIEWTAKSDEEWYKRFGVEYTFEKDYMNRKVISRVDNHYNRQKYYRMIKQRSESRETARTAYDLYEAHEVKHAIAHYENSIVKLASRLKDKGITDGSDFEITRESIGVNIHLTIKHGDKITRAWTIVAEGMIQRAHYRYLVK